MTPNIGFLHNKLANISPKLINYGFLQNSKVQSREVQWVEQLQSMISKDAVWRC